jgi:hypothetical protein
VHALTIGWLIWTGLMGCRLFGSLQEAVDLLENPVTMQGIYVGLDVPLGLDTAGTDLESGAQAQAWVQETSTDGVNTATGSKVSLVADRAGSVKLAEEEGYWSANGLDGLEYVEEDDVRLIVAVGGVAGERSSIRMSTPLGAVVDIPENHTAGVGIRVDMTDQYFDNGGVLVANLFTGEEVWRSDYDIQEPVDPDNLLIDIEGTVFLPDQLYGIGVLGLVASDEDALQDLNKIGSGMLSGVMVMHLVSTMGG